MSFQSLGFLVFLAAAVGGCRVFGLYFWGMDNLRPWPSGTTAGEYTAANAIFLALFSVFFYMLGCAAAGSVELLLVPVPGIFVTWLAAGRLQSGRKHRRLTLGLAALWHIAVLLAFKYAGFLTGGRFALPFTPPGISFFTFQQLWLLKEVYTGAFSLERDESSGFLAYSLFFPTVTSGPILKPQSFFPQLRRGVILPTGEDAAAGLYALSRGYAKKLLLADPLGVVVANGWAQGPEMTAPTAWVVILGYTLQLYLDFSGYCDIASGCARLLGLRLPVNFDAPYRSLSVGEFWKRWHMTLTSFLRECVYFPLGGSRRGMARACGNILIVYLISGFWHGSGWTFLVWGLLHGLAQILERLWPGRERLPKGVRWGMTFLFVNLCWVFFQAPSLSAAGMLLRRAVCGGGGLPLETLAAGALDTESAALRTLLPMVSELVPGLVLAALFGAGLAVSLRRRGVVQRMEDFRPTFANAAVSAVLLVWAVLSFSSTAAFIYANF